MSRRRRAFTCCARLDIDGLIVYRFVSPVARLVSEATLRRHVITLGQPEVLVPAGVTGVVMKAADETMCAQLSSRAKRFSLSGMPQLTLEARSEAQVALELACEHLLSLQDDAGWWRGELQTNVTMDAEDMLLREFLGIRRADETERSAAWIRSQQRADGTWANFHGGPGELSTTIEAYWALRLAGDAPEAEHMRAAAEFIRGEGGLERARVFTHVWLALFGLWSWERVPALPPEVILLPPSVPLNVYDFACWARQTIVALSIVKAHRPVRPLPFDLDELHAPADDAQPDAPAEGGRSRRRAGSDASTGCCAPTSAARWRRCAGWRSPGPSAGSCVVRRPTAPGAASSRRGCTR